MSKQDKKFRINELLLVLIYQQIIKLTLNLFAAFVTLKQNKKTPIQVFSSTTRIASMALIPTDIVLVSETWETLLHSLRMQVRSLSLVPCLGHVVLSCRAVAGKRKDPNAGLGTYRDEL